MKIIFIFFSLSSLINPVHAITTKMFKVLDTCARYRIEEIDTNQALEKLKLKTSNYSQNEANDLVSKYCSVFTPNEKIEY